LSQQPTLERLEALLESFLERAVALKGNRLDILDGINRLDDIARGGGEGGDLSERIGEWFADHNDWLAERPMRPGDIGRIGGIMEEIRTQLRSSGDYSPEMEKIESEIARWKPAAGAKASKIVLHRPPESAERPAAPLTGPDEDSISRFGKALQRIRDLYTDLSGPRKHVLSVLDSSLRSADLQKNKEALLLSAVVIYYLKLDGYKVEPYVKRLREAERVIRGDKASA